MVFKGVSNNVKLEEFKELLDFNEITHAEAERMKSKRSGRDLPLIKIKCDDTKQAKALISGGLVCQKTDIIFNTTLDPTVFHVPGFRAQGTKLHPKTEMCCV